MREYSFAKALFVASLVAATGCASPEPESADLELEGDELAAEDGFNGTQCSWTFIDENENRVRHTYRMRTYRYKLPAERARCQDAVSMVMKSGTRTNYKLCATAISPTVWYGNKMPQMIQYASSVTVACDNGKIYRGTSAAVM